MKKFTLLLAALIALSGFSACASQDAQLGPISLDDAKLAAIEAAGFNLSDVIVEDIDLEEKGGQKYYSVDFEVNGKDYEVIIDALTGEIISSNIPAAEVNNEAVQPVVQDEKSSPDGLINEAKAKEIALNHSGKKESDVTFVKVKLDWDDGRQEYEVEFYTKDYLEYDYEIDATNGAVISFDLDAEDYVKPVAKEEAKPAASSAPKAESKDSSVISEAKAKEIALNHAGVKKSEVSFTVVKLDWDDGRQEYEVDFYKGNVEYDYEIDAVSGAILSADKEVEDDVRPVVKEESKKEDSKPAASSAPKAEKPSASVSESEAKKIALAQVPGAKESDIRGFKVDYDDGRVQYEGKIIYNEMEYEFEIDGHSGAIRDWDVESVYDD